MGYRDDLIQRMKDDGLWDHLSDEQRREWAQLSDEQAGKMMADMDSLAYDPDTQEKIGKILIKEVLEAFLSVFGGRLLELQGEHIGKLSRAGMLLAEFIDELEKQGIPWAAISDDFPKLNNTNLIIGLRELYRRRKEQS